jgi:hypothetical protein
VFDNKDQAIRAIYARLESTAAASARRRFSE